MSDKIKTVYIAGNITGDPNYREKFAQAQRHLEAQGYIVLNPAVLPQGLSNADYLRIGYAMMDSAEIVAFLPNWQFSEGAVMEHRHCEYTCKGIIDLSKLCTPYMPAQPDAADVAPVVHGRWIATESVVWSNRCSLCRSPARIMHNYCPNCGAKMDGGKEDAAG